MKNRFICILTLILLKVLIISGCGDLRSEIFREETLYIYKLATNEYLKGEYDKARKYFRQVISLDPNYSRAYAGIGNVEYLKENFSEAAELYRAAIYMDFELKESILHLLLRANGRNAEIQTNDQVASLKEVYQCLASGDFGKVEEIVERDISLSLLAKDRISINSKELEKLDAMVIELAESAGSPAKVRFFLGSYTYYRDINKIIAAKLLEDASRELSGGLEKEACILAGKAYEESGYGNRAIGLYMRAIRAGASLDEIAPLMADIYGVRPDEMKETLEDVSRY